MTDYQRTLAGFCAGTLLVVIGVASFLLGRQAGRKGANLPVQVKTDTLIVRDTIREKYPVYSTKYVTRMELVEVRDTIRQRDTLYQAVEIERRTYQGDDYRAVVEGWRPELAEIQVYPKTVYLQTEISQPPDTRRKTRLGVGLGVGPGVYWNGSAIQPGIGVTAGLALTF